MVRPSSPGGPRFLVVDDIAVGRNMLRATLARHGDVDVAESGPSALSMYRSATESGGAYDLVLLDIMMPEMDGITVIEELRSFERATGLPGVKVVMTTALDQREHVHAALAAGAAAYLIKPLDVRTVVGLLERLELID